MRQITGNRTISNHVYEKRTFAATGRIVVCLGRGV